ncbi:MAG: GGDEF domain-containing protein [Magnetospirillum sp.]|nr:GGDEF domain-containing protein [Magnetospirillum sp.]
MGSDYRTERVDPTRMVQEFPPGHDGQPRRHLPPHAYEHHEPPRHPSAADVASVLGLPADAISPELLAAVVPLLAEIDRLHWAADHAQRRADWLERQSDRHSVVPCLTRRAFVRELETFLAGGETEGVLALVQVAGIEALRQLYGLAAGEAALRHVAGNILGALRASDMVGCLGGSDFAVLLPGTPEEQARAKMQSICARIADPAFVWLGFSVPLTPAHGLYTLKAGEGAEVALAAADLARRGLG